jgi:hypothetical protein
MPTSKRQRESPTYVPMGIEKDMLVRIDRPLKSELKHLMKLLYKGLPPPSFGQFICFCMSVGMDAVRDKYLRGSHVNLPPADGGPADV